MDLLGRTLMTIGCTDADSIRKVSDAGRIVETTDGPVQIMHNGLKVVAGGYYGDWMAHVIRSLRGHHEPQEELIFDSIVRFSRHNSLIVELGAFWAYYSLWYVKDVPGSRAICVEPDPINLRVGKQNATLNSLQNRMEFHNAWIGGSYKDQFTLRGESTKKDVTLPSFDMDHLVTLCKGNVVEVLHLDVQGAELAFLESMHSAVSNRLVRFLIVSTHHSSISGSKTTHENCVDVVKRLGGTIFVEHDVQESFSGDGLIVASFFEQDAQLSFPEVSRNTARNSLFPEL
ncbi:MAG: FkbM family methyltransferase [Mesorhizobium sp.]|uniref:FkbM family methyltransferase n=1 Tax=Mesorhizobium sp. TaxID=1871066 RepID=UPI001201DEF3|nr:FkbM family methyltransferase [Mesorhizobium sp.]TIS57544.1 MAG: FkbM family methyltransferase [Mesorhizobium sp.]TIS59590.1 MAG: FkbM family methyltransferase [Mesorhizobium sp.]